jgi:AraC-like DNA-binding protein
LKFTHSFNGLPVNDGGIASLVEKPVKMYTDKSAKEIAFELGFSDPVQFSRLFKRETGITPGDFKRQGILSSTHKKEAVHRN